ncbi:MAG: hypothetical protein A2Y07_02280 [Planctomycetes bacterium GWF2_50_10]|nr:MAG: hypothetical protein A2Y07_02280 [Planctomycetes bacterium GWF2_50_10]
MTEQTTTQINKVVRSTAGRPAMPAQMMNSLTPKEIMGILRRHVLLIIMTTIGGLILGGAAWALLFIYAPKFTASGFIEVYSPTKSDPWTFNSQIAPKDILFQARMNKAILIKQQSTLEDLLKRDAVKETTWYKSTDNLNDAIDNLKNNLDVSAQRDSDYVSVSMTCSKPKEAQLIVNELMTLFYRSQQTGANNEITDRLAQLRKQETSIQSDLKLAEDSLENLRVAAADLGIMGMSSVRGENNRQTVTLTLNDLTIQRDKLHTDITQMQANMGTLEELAKGPIGVQIQNMVESDPIMINLGERRSLLEADLARKLTRFGANHREVRQTRESIKQTVEERNSRQLLISEQTRQANWRNAQDQLVYMKSKLAELERLRQEAEAKQKDLDRRQAEYESKLKIRDERIEMLSSIKTQIEKVNAQLGDPDSPKIRIAGLAPEPLEVSSPKWLLYFAAGPMLGMLLGIALAFMLELLNDIVRTPSDVSKYLRVSLLGMIPDASEDDLVQGVDMVNVVRQAPYSITSECYRRFRTNLRLSGSADSLRSILVTSGSQNEGKTSTSLNLAATFVAEEKKVVFVDTNFRKPVSQQLFPVEPSQEYTGAGLSSFLMGRVQVDEIIRSSGLEGLDVIDCGQAPLNPAEMLASSKMRSLLDELRKRYDHVILDGAPVLLVSDAKMLASMADSTVVVFNASVTKRGAAIRTLRELNECNANVSGSVLMGVKALKGGYFQEMFDSYREYTRTQLAHTI